MNRLFGLVLISVLFAVTGCAVNKASKVFGDVSTEGLTYNGTDIFYEGAHVASLSAVEVAYDDGKVVHEATFVLTSADYNKIALSIIKFIQEKKADENWEVEVELKMGSIE